MNGIFSNSLTFFCLLLLFVSCRNLNPNNDKNSLKPKDSLSSTEMNIANKYSEIGFELMKNESFGEIKLGVKLNKITEILGEPDSKSKSELWGADGEYHQEWNYTNRGIIFDFIGKPDSFQVVNMITITEPCEFKTTRNIGIGSNMEEVQTAYRQEINAKSSNTETIIAGTVYGGIIFNFENKKVKSIFIGASAE